MQTAHSAENVILSSLLAPALGFDSQEPPSFLSIQTNANLGVKYGLGGHSLTEDLSYVLISKEEGQGEARGSSKAVPLLPVLT